MGDVTVSMDTKAEAIGHLHDAIQALVKDEYGNFAFALGNADRVLKESQDMEMYLVDTGNVVTGDCIGPNIYLPGGHALWTTRPEERDPEYLFSVNLNDHAHLRVDGERKREPTLVLRSDEFPAHVRIEDPWGKFESIEVGEDTALEPEVVADGC